MPKRCLLLREFSHRDAAALCCRATTAGIFARRRFAIRAPDEPLMSPATERRYAESSAPSYACFRLRC